MWSDLPDVNELSWIKKKKITNKQMKHYVNNALGVYK